MKRSNKRERKLRKKELPYLSLKRMLRKKRAEKQLLEALMAKLAKRKKALAEKAEG